MLCFCNMCYFTGVSSLVSRGAVGLHGGVRLVRRDILAARHVAQRVLHLVAVHVKRRRGRERLVAVLKLVPVVEFCV